ncbi:MAG TPA: cytochrome c3 family protein [Desulfatiglandales bacterium]|nr:cytochrome c3 family protein [Desulfatiglandales bacterium]
MSEEFEMKKLIIRNSSIIMVFTILMVFLAVTLLPASEEKEMPEDIVFDEEICKHNRKGPVAFSHITHAEDYELSCTECHHEYKDGKNVWEEGDPVKKCGECHDPCESKGNIKKLYLAFHKNCKGCHRRLKKEWGSTDAPYKACKDCHELK